MSLTKGETIPLSYKFEFDTTNNVTEYEALILFLQATKNLKIDNLLVFGYFESVMKKIKGQFQTKHPILRPYWNKFGDIIEKLFSTFNIKFLPREKNMLANSLEIVASTFKPHHIPQLRYEIEIRH